MKFDERDPAKQNGTENNGSVNPGLGKLADRFHPLESTRRDYLLFAPATERQRHLFSFFVFRREEERSKRGNNRACSSFPPPIINSIVGDNVAIHFGRNLSFSLSLSRDLSRSDIPDTSRHGFYPRLYVYSARRSHKLIRPFKRSVNRASEARKRLSHLVKFYPSSNRTTLALRVLHEYILFSRFSNIDHRYFASSLFSRPSLINSTRPRQRSTRRDRFRSPHHDRS